VCVWVCACVCARVACVRACLGACMLHYKMRRLNECATVLDCQQRQRWSGGRHIFEGRTTNEREKLPIWSGRRHYFLLSTSWCPPRMRRRTMVGLSLLYSTLSFSLVSHFVD